MDNKGNDEFNISEFNLFTKFNRGVKANSRRVDLSKSQNIVSIKSNKDNNVKSIKKQLSDESKKGGFYSDTIR